MLLELSKGVAILLSLYFVQSLIARRWKEGQLSGQVLSGLLFGGMVIVGMLIPVVVAPGHFADARSVVVSMAALFGGPVVGGIAAGIGGGFRLWEGGGGASVGVGAVVVCMVLGLVYRHFNKRGWVRIRFFELLAFGLIVHLVIVYMFTFLPDPVVDIVLENVAVPFVLVFTPATALLGVLLHSTNVQIATETALAASERRFKDIAESTSDWIWEMGPDLRFTYFSRRDGAEEVDYLAKRIGTRREEGVSDREREQQPEEWAAHMADLEARRPFRDFEYAMSGADGRPRHFRVSGNPIFAPDGTFQGYRGTGADVTAVKAAERAVQESEEHYRDLFDGLEVGIYVEKRNRGVFANPACVGLAGFESVDALLDVSPQALVAERDRQRVAQCVENLYASRSNTIQFECDWKKRDGSSIPVREFARHITWDGEPAIMRTIVDLTEWKRAEELLHQAQKMEAVGQLTGGVAHDFNNILTSVTGNLELAANKADQGGVVHNLIRRALAAAWRAAVLTERLLAFSRKQSLVPRVINAHSLVEGMADLLQRTVEESITIECRGAPDLWTCRVDPNLLESAILNLAINARDAMPDGGSLTIQTENADLREDACAARTGVTPGEYVLVTVTDTGIGMSADVVERAFEPFFTSKDVGKGSGLGLSMVYGFVNQSGGHVKIVSNEGEGTTVKLFLPRANAPAEGGDREVPGTEHPEGRGETVLVVEDDADVRELSVTQLSRLGYEVLQAADGPSALSIVQNGAHIDLVFTDIVLPGGMNGTQLAAEVERLRPGIAILYTSGYTEGAISKDVADDGDIDLLKKPFRLQELARKVRTSIDRSAD